MICSAKYHVEKGVNPQSEQKCYVLGGSFLHGVVI